MVKASLVRAVFAIHAFIAVWRVVDTKGGDSFYWLLTVTITLLAFEGIVSLCSRRGEEMRWYVFPLDLFSAAMDASQAKYLCVSMS